MDDVQAALWILIQAVQAVWSAGYDLLCGEISRSASFFVVLAVLGNIMICPLIAYFIKANTYLIRCISNWFFLALFLNWTMFKSSDEVEEYVSIRLSDKYTQYPSCYCFRHISSCYSFLYPTVRKYARRSVVHTVLYISVHHTTLHATSSHDSVQMFHTPRRYT